MKAKILEAARAIDIPEGNGGNLMASKGLCRKCYGETRINWVLFNHGPLYNPFRVCELVCKDCGRPFFTFWFAPVKRKSKIAKCRLVFDKVLSSAIHKQLAI